MTTEKRNYDVIIIGGGPAGLTAGIYTARARLNTLLIEKAMVGGQITNAEEVDNFPGFPHGINGYELGQLIYEQATKYGLTTIMTETTGVRVHGKQKFVNTAEGEYSAGALIIASGSQRQKLGVPGEEKYVGRGVSYCATCDAAFFKDKPVAVVGGGDAAVTEALHLAKFGSKVTLIHRREQLRASKILQEKAFADKKIDFVWNTTIEEIEGDTFVKALKLKNVSSGQKSSLEVNGIFVSIGFTPETAFLKGLLPLNPAGHIITNEKLETEKVGILAAGDVRHNSGRQAITAAGDGATAAIYAEHYLTEQA